jgi:hypothetical protein
MRGAFLLAVTAGLYIVLLEAGKSFVKLRKFKKTLGIIFLRLAVVECVFSIEKISI